MNSRKSILSILFTLFLILLALNSQAAAISPLGRDPAAVGQEQEPAQYLPVVMNGYSPGGEWSQHGHDAQHTSYTASSVPTPWRWKWAWNGPDAAGAVTPGKFGLPRNVQPVTGGGRVYIAAGTRGVYALNSASGSVAWNRNPGGAINSTPAYDPQTGALFVVSTNGRLYRLDAANGGTTGEFDAQAASSLPLPPAIAGDRVYFSMGSRVLAVRKSDLGLAWAYEAGSPVETPPAVSSTAGLVVAASQDLHMHAIRETDGGRAWRVKPTPLSPGNPGDSAPDAQVSYGWPVIAEGHGLVLIKLRLNWQTLWTWSPWPVTNAQMRANLASNPGQQALYALRFSDGGTAFTTNIGHGGFGDGGRLDMGPQPVVKRYADGSEVAYVVMRGSPCSSSPCDGRYDSHLGELMLDGDTVMGYQAGDVRFMQNTFFPTDEQPNLSMAGNDLFGGHWMFGIAHQIVDRGAGRGESAMDPITMNNLPHIITSASNCAFSANHGCTGGLIQDGDPRSIPGGFYIYYDQGTVYDQYWSNYAAWVVSAGTVYFLSTDGAVAAMESGTGSTAVVIPAIQVDPVEMPRSPEMPAKIDYRAARSYAGQAAEVEGEVRFVFNNRKAVLLGFEDPHEGAFKTMIRIENWARFSAGPERIYPPGMRLRVRGVIEWYQGDPVIYVRGPEQIEVVGEAED